MDIIDKTKCCSICQKNAYEPVYMSCSSFHTYCFSCITKWYKTKEYNTTCPVCRGGDDCIILSNIKPEYSTDYYSLYTFLYLQPYLCKILNITENNNTCIIPSRLIILYMKNKSSIEILHGYLSNKNITSTMNIKDIIKCIKWDIPPNKCKCNNNLFINTSLSNSSYSRRTYPYNTDSFYRRQPPSTSSFTIERNVNLTPINANNNNIV